VVLLVADLLVELGGLVVERPKLGQHASPRDALRFGCRHQPPTVPLAAVVLVDPEDRDVEHAVPDPPGEAADDLAGVVVEQHGERLGWRRSCLREGVTAEPLSQDLDVGLVG
jgi:hypothetical protein